MSKFRVKGNIDKEDLVTHVLNNVPKEYDMILVGLENHLALSHPIMLTIKVMCKKLNHQYEKSKNKNEER